MQQIRQGPKELRNKRRMMEKSSYLADVHSSFCWCFKEGAVKMTGQVLALVFPDYTFIFKVTLVANQQHGYLQQSGQKLWNQILWTDYCDV